MNVSELIDMLSYEDVEGDVEGQLAVNGKIVLAGKPLIERKRRQRGWKKEDVDALRDLKKAGKTHAEIAQLMGRTPMAIKSASSDKICKPERVYGKA